LNICANYWTTVSDQEVICFVECLLLHCINGNPRNFSQRLFTTLGVRRSVLDSHLPYFRFPWKNMVGESPVQTVVHLKL
jgi:hypothetical protein